MNATAHVDIKTEEFFRLFRQEAAEAEVLLRAVTGELDRLESKRKKLERERDALYRARPGHFATDEEEQLAREHQAVVDAIGRLRDDEARARRTLKDHTRVLAAPQALKSASADKRQAADRKAFLERQAKARTQARQEMLSFAEGQDRAAAAARDEAARASLSGLPAAIRETLGMPPVHEASSAAEPATAATKHEAHASAARAAAAKITEELEALAEQVRECDALIGDASRRQMEAACCIAEVEASLRLGEYVAALVKYGAMHRVAFDVDPEVPVRELTEAVAAGVAVAAAELRRQNFADQLDGESKLLGAIGKLFKGVFAAK